MIERIVRALKDIKDVVVTVFNDDSIVSIPGEHYQVHAGRHFFVSNGQDVASGNTLQHLIKVPNRDMEYHFTYAIDAEGEMEIGLYEGTTVSANGTALTIVNRNRMSEKNPTMLLYTGPTVSDAGTLLDYNIVGSGKSFGGRTRGEQELVLKPGTDYLFNIENAGVGALWVDWNYDWYEKEERYATR